MFLLSDRYHFFSYGDDAVYTHFIVNHDKFDVIKEFLHTFCMDFLTLSHGVRVSPELCSRSLDFHT